MPMRRVATVAIFVAMQGCAALTPLKAPVAAARAATGTSLPKQTAALPVKSQATGALTPAAKPSAAAAAPIATSLALQIPSDISVKLPKGLIGAGATGVISNDGGSVISNDGGSVISNDGGSVISNDGGSVISNDGGSFGANGGAGYTLAAVEPGVVSTFRSVTETYAFSVTLANTMLSLTADADNRALLVAGQKLVLDPIFHDFHMELHTAPGQDAVIEVFHDVAPQNEVLRLQFSDADHGSVMMHGDAGLVPNLQHPFEFTTTFDRQKNSASIEDYSNGYTVGTANYGKTRFHLDIARPASPVAGGPTLVLHLNMYSRDSNVLPEGVMDATAYAQAGGASSVIFGTSGVGGSLDQLAFLTNPNGTADAGDPQAFFIDPSGSLLNTPDAALKANVPPQTDVVKPFFGDTDAVDYTADPVFTFPN